MHAPQASPDEIVLLQPFTSTSNTMIEKAVNRLSKHFTKKILLGIGLLLLVTSIVFSSYGNNLSLSTLSAEPMKLLDQEMASHPLSPVSTMYTLGKELMSRTFFATPSASKSLVTYSPSPPSPSAVLHRPLEKLIIPLHASKVIGVDRDAMATGIEIVKGENDLLEIYNQDTTFHHLLGLEHASLIDSGPIPPLTSVTYDCSHLAPGVYRFISQNSKGKSTGVLIIHEKNKKQEEDAPKVLVLGHSNQ